MIRITHLFAIVILLTQTVESNNIFPSRSRLFCVGDHARQSGNISCSSNLKIWITGIQVGYSEQRCEHTNYCQLELLNTTHNYYKNRAISCQHRSRCQFNAVELLAKYVFENCGFAHTSRNTVKVHYKCVSSLDIPLFPGDLLNLIDSTTTPNPIQGGDNSTNQTVEDSPTTVSNLINLRRTTAKIIRRTTKFNLVKTGRTLPVNPELKTNKVDQDQDSGLSEKTAFEVVIPLLTVAIIICLIIASACFIAGKRARLRQARCTSVRPRTHKVSSGQQNEGFIYFKTNEQLMMDRGVDAGSSRPDTIAEEDMDYTSQYVDQYNGQQDNGFRVR